MTRRRPFQPLTTTRYDAIVIGTALPQALLAAALARQGSTVLHLDPLSFYGSSNATLTTAQLSSALSDFHNQPNGLADSYQNSAGSTLETTLLPSRSLGETIFPLGGRILTDGPVQASIDLVPRPLMAAGSMVDLLIRSDVGHYIDFRPLDALFVQFTSGLRRVPASRSDVFQSRSISMPEKRLLMRFVKRCQEDSADDVAPEGTFSDFMDEMALTPSLRTFLIQSIAFCSAEISAQEGVNAVYRYQQSLMRFGTKTPFLYPNYGSGELAQAFCRLCAVNGGTYVLRRGAAAIIRGRDDDDDVEYPVGVVTTENEIVRARHVFLPKDMLGPASHNASAVWRFAAVLDGSITKDNQPDRVLVTVPCGVCGNNVDVRLRQLDGSVMVCESGTYVLYAETVGAGTEDDVIAAARKYVRMDDEGRVQDAAGEQVYREEDGEGSEEETLDCQSNEKPLVLWSISYARPIDSQADSDVGGIVSMLSVEEGIDADQFIKEAERCFRIAEPDGAFFPETRREETASAVEDDMPNGHVPEAESVEAVGD